MPSRLFYVLLVKMHKKYFENSNRLFKFDKNYFTNDYISAIMKTTKNGSDFKKNDPRKGQMIYDTEE